MKHWIKTEGTNVLYDFSLYAKLSNEQHDHKAMQITAPAFHCHQIIMNELKE